MRSLRLKKNLPKDCYVQVIECDACGMESTTEPIFDVETAGLWNQWNMCITCIYKRWPEFVEVVE